MKESVKAWDIKALLMWGPVVTDNLGIFSRVGGSLGSLDLVNYWACLGRLLRLMGPLGLLIWQGMYITATDLKCTTVHVHDVCIQCTYSRTSVVKQPLINKNVIVLIWHHKQKHQTVEYIYMLRTNLKPAARFKAVQTVLKPAGPFQSRPDGFKAVRACFKAVWVPSRRF